MNQREFEVIANIIKGEMFTSYDQTDPDYCIVDGIDDQIVLNIIEAFATGLKREYPRTFDRDKFMQLF